MLKLFLLQKSIHPLTKHKELATSTNRLEENVYQSSCSVVPELSCML